MSKLLTPWPVLGALAFGTACGGSQPEAGAPAESAEPVEGTSAERSSRVINESDAPEISRSRGKKGGIVVLWPRVVVPHGQRPDADTVALAGRIQAQLAELAQSVADEIDVRPEPERVCPQQGCEGASLGAVLARAGNGCAVVALVSGPGISAASLIPWSPGLIELNAQHVKFRSPPENVMQIKDYSRCSELPTSLAEKTPDVEKMLHKLVQQ